jgi:hypothetical protein
MADSLNVGIQIFHILSVPSARNVFPPELPYRNLLSRNAAEPARQSSDRPKRSVAPTLWLASVTPTT